VWILTVTADGAVPIAYRAVDGNTNDDVTHTDTWDGLVALVGRADLLYVADSKLATRANMDHIARHQGRFVAVLPATRKEDAAFRDWIVDHEPDWVEALRRPARRRQAPDDVWETCEAPWPSAEGYRITWVRSSAKTARDAENRHQRIARGIGLLDDLNQRLASPKRRIKTAVAVEAAAEAALAKAGAGRWIRYEVLEEQRETFRQENRGRPGNNTRYRKTVRLRHRVTFTVDENQVAHDAASDGCFPLISNDRDMTGEELLVAYKWQLNLEKRHAQLKGTQLVAPMFLRDPARIEGLLCCHFIAMLIQALIANARSGLPCPRPASLSCRSTPKTAAVPRQPPSAYSKSSPASPATTSSVTAASSRPSDPNPPNYNARSWTYSHPHQRLHRHLVTGVGRPAFSGHLMSV
jgi:transposase